MVPWTDVKFTIQMVGADLSDAREIWLTLRQGKYNKLDTDNVEVIGVDEEGTWLGVRLTQQDTSIFVDDASIEAQVNWVDANGERPTPPPPSVIEVGTQLLKRILGQSEQEESDEG